MTIYWLEQREADVPPDNHWLSPNELNRLGTLRIPKRRADWRLGRWTAKHAVASFLALSQPALPNIEIRAASSGAPEVFFHNKPADVAISLSHSSGAALCTVATSGTNFGCDLETIEPRDAAFIADYFTTEEQLLVEGASIQDRPLLLALLWSAKESTLKGLHTGLRLATTSVSVSLDGELQSPRDRHSDSQREWLPISARYSGQIFNGFWRAEGNLVRTVVSDSPRFILQRSPRAQRSLATSLAT